MTKDEYKHLKFQVETSSNNEEVILKKKPILEYTDLRSQVGTSSKTITQKNYGGVRKMPYVFTQEGVAMLSSVLRTEVASKISIEIMRAFVTMRKYISNELIEQKYINKLVFQHDEEIKILQNYFSNFKTFSNEIFSKDKYMMLILY